MYDFLFLHVHVCTVHVIIADCQRELQRLKMTGVK